MTDHEVQGVLGMQHSEKRQWRPYLLVVMGTKGSRGSGEYHPFAFEENMADLAFIQSAAIIIIAGAILAGSVHVAQFIVFRFVSGAG
ncbi:hypothetical protein J7337_003297 [Fusarium musae]|uniref:Uncharacterized protein n=1 Tax=Fusarium musae TaxID=1042133 RepID=A0A9P8IUI4_9HYPO|nr:hypothetical protein J7337_003297 [Fusarium musae]KAG9506314.1 hypothetical protein J7337_003297 [Fusarium musae]